MQIFEEQQKEIEKRKNELLQKDKKHSEVIILITHESLFSF
jgi:hypothetical protein